MQEKEECDFITDHIHKKAYTNNKSMKGAFFMSVLKLTKENFEQEVLHAEEPVLVDFWAPWCGPCRMVSPLVDQVAKEVTGKAKVGKVNVDEQPELANAFQVMSIPTLVVLKNGKVVKISVGAKGKEQIKEMLNV